MEEAAWVDGAGHLGTLLRIVVPLIAPGIVAAGIICLILSYNELLFALVLTYRPETQTLPVGIALFQGDRLVQFGQMAAASLAGMAPVLRRRPLFPALAGARPDKRSGEVMAPRPSQSRGESDDGVGGRK